MPVFCVWCRERRVPRVRRKCAISSFFRAPRAWDEQAAIDRLVGHMKGFVVRVGMLQPAGDLLRRPPEAKLMCHEVGQRSVLHQFTDLRAATSVPRSLIRLAGPIASRALITSDLAT